MNTPYESSDFSGWNEERNFIDMGVEKMLAPAPHRPQWNRDDRPGEELDSIIRENVEASQRNQQATQ